jgi:hypothetical protein
MSLLGICTLCTSGEKRLTERRKKTLAKLASEFKKLLANSKFHSHLVSWRVVISTPGNAEGLTVQSYLPVHGYLFSCPNGDGLQ